MRKIAAEQPVSAVSSLAADAAFKLSVSERPTNLRRMSPSMRRSDSSLASGRHMSSSPGHPFVGRQASSFKDSRATSANSSHSASSVDTRHIRLTMEKRDSKSSIYSGGSTMGETSRPLSTESIDSSSPRPRVGSSHSTSHLTTNDTDGSTTTVTVHVVDTRRKNNTRIVAPNNPLGGRPMPPPLKKQNTVPDLRRPRSHYIGELVWEIDETVYCGGLDAAYNLNLLCRLNIEYIVDLSGLDEDNMPRAKRGDCPCLCSRPTAHSRALMAINVDENSTQDLVPYFRDVNAFIDKAKAVKKCVLVHCQFGKNLAPAFVSSYLMRSLKISRVNAVEMVMSLCPNVSINENIQKSLRKWEAVVGVSEGVTHSDEGPSNRLSVPQFATKRAAWT